MDTTSNEYAGSETSPTTPQRIAGWGRGITCVGYHLVAEKAPDHVRFLFPTKTPLQLEDDLKWMQRRGGFVSYDDLAAAARGARTLPGRAFHLTFDDGMAECHWIVAPLLGRHGATATFFVTTDFLDNRVAFYRNVVSLCLARLERVAPDELPAVLAALETVAGRNLANRKVAEFWLRSLYHEEHEQLAAATAALDVDVDAFLATAAPYLSREQVCDLAQAGHTIGAHSLSHPRFRSLADPEQVEREIAESCRIVAELTGQREVPFSLPFGGSHLDPDMVTRVRQRHPRVGLIFDTSGVPGNDSLLLPRVMADDPRGARDGRSNLGALIRRTGVRRLEKTLKSFLSFGRSRNRTGDHQEARA